MIDRLLSLTVKRAVECGVRRGVYEFGLGFCKPSQNTLLPAAVMRAVVVRFELVQRCGRVKEGACACRTFSDWNCYHSVYIEE